jgi:hypothetical protein
MTMSSRNMRIVTLAFVAVAQLTLQAQAEKAGRIEAARKELFVNSKEDLQRLHAPGYLPSKITALRTLIREEILRQLNRSASNDSVLLAGLESALTKDSKPLSVIHKQLAGAEFIIVGYSIRHGPSAQPDSTVVIEAYRKGPDGYEFVDQTGEGLTNSTSKLEELPSPWTTEIWLLAHGQQTEVMQYHERVQILSFDGVRFKDLWNHDPLWLPNFLVERNELRITFEKEGGVGQMVLTLALLPQGPKEISLLEKQ